LEKIKGEMSVSASLKIQEVLTKMNQNYRSSKLKKIHSEFMDN